MKKFFQEIVTTISDFKFYKEAKDFQVSRGAKYIFSLILLITIVLTIRYSYDINRGLGMVAKWAKENLPPIEITDGIVSVEVWQPYKIIEEDFVLIIDTTGEVTSLDEYERGVLLMKDRVLYKDDVKTESYDLSTIKSLRIDENFMNSFRKNALWVLFPFLLLFSYIRFCIARFLQIFIVSPISMAIATIINIKLTYRQLLNIGIYAITPSTILGALMAILGLQLPLFWMLYSGVYIIYIIMAILNCREEHVETPSA